MTKTPMWMVRADRGGVLADEFRDKSIVAVGWKRLGDLSGVTARPEILKLVGEAWPEQSERQTLVSGSQLYRFRSELKLDDRIVTYDPGRRVYLIGSIQGDYAYESSIAGEFSHYRRVKWDGEVKRDSLSASTRNSLGAISTLFRIPPDAAFELESHLKGEPSGAEVDETEEEEDLLKDLQARSHEFIKDQVSKLDWDEMQELVAGLLRAMGYKTQVSPPGSDRGKDVVASPDGFGFEQPRIVVEVKHRAKQAIGATDIRSFLGGRHKDDKGLYVSTGGFSREARYEAERASIPIMLMDSDDLVAAIVEHYEKMDSEARGLLPLKRLYWPA